MNFRGVLLEALAFLLQKRDLFAELCAGGARFLQLRGKLMAGGDGALIASILNQPHTGQSKHQDDDKRCTNHNLEV